MGAPPDPLAGFKGPTSMGREGKGREGKSPTPPVEISQIQPW